MAKILLQQLGEYQHLYRDTKTGLAWVENGSVGCSHTCHANIDASGSLRGMRDRGYWRKQDRTIRVRGFIYNIDTFVVSDKYDEIAAEHCKCGGKHGEKLFHVYWMSDASKSRGETEEADLAGFVRLTPKQREVIEERMTKNAEDAVEDDFTIEEVTENLTFDEVLGCFPEIDDGQ